MQDIRKKNEAGFTLLELLIVIAVIAILSAIVIFVLNPTETMKKSRDTQRISDLGTLKNAIGLYVTTTQYPDLGPKCLGTGVTDAKIYYSVPQAVQPVCAVNVAEGGDVTALSVFDVTGMCDNPATAAAAVKVDGTGWIPVNLGSISGGSPISNLPLDPTNTIATGTAPKNTDLAYRYACQEVGATPAPENVFEIDAVLESQAFGPGGEDDRSAKDGGDNANYYEIGTSVGLLGAGTNF